MEWVSWAWAGAGRRHWAAEDTDQVEEACKPAALLYKGAC
jgi:hypothetical protein